LGTDRGVLSFDFESGASTLSLWSGCAHDISKFRANDGARLGLIKIIGFMHRNNAAQKPGFVYIHRGNGLSLIDDSIYIPSLFVALSGSKMLISDSLKGRVWLYTFDNSYSVVGKELWHEYEENISPDGGCCIGEKIVIALWGGHSVSVLDLNGIETDRLHIDVPQPTNCKYDREANELWLTSAREGLNDASLARWPNSGDTFCFDLGGLAC
jgi:sugar lactone lactonase YvrE